MPTMLGLPFQRPALIARARLPIVAAVVELRLAHRGQQGAAARFGDDLTNHAQARPASLPHRSVGAATRANRQEGI